MAIAYVGIGSNFRPENNIHNALSLLASEFMHLQCSPVYQCAAQGYPSDVTVADYLNLVVQFETSLAPRALIKRLKLLEKQLGREPNLKAYAPKVIDLDLLLLEPLPADTPTSLPHADILTCAYILLPLSQLLPRGIHPQEQRSYAQLWQDLKPTLAHSSMTIQA